ncbi:hypothetical protein KVT40_000595 [Elsinoe batatas]|uniref:Choline transport protein n=1 Tax=Elsinoe batatas TaxID=2601811 RepID=A0A8K0PGK3_9PEZI|nr:hypothetical protein KVT40_000595 [Elsinoe batatas]
MFCSTLSMAEMASMAPTAGGQHHWVSEFAPPQAQKILSYLVGWMCVLGYLPAPIFPLLLTFPSWQTAMAASAYTPALALQGLIAINNPTYTLPPYQAYLFTIAILLLSIIINIFLIRRFKTIETFMVVFFFLSWISIIAVLWAKSKKAPARQVSTSFTDGSGWGSLGLATLIGGLPGGFVSLIGSDSAAHLSEEAMVLTALANYLTATVAVITLCFTLGGSAEDLLETRYGQPYIQVLYNAVKSRGGASVLTAVVTVLLLFTSINQVATTSRQLYAFARDDGFPFSRFLKKVNPAYNIPINSLFATFMFTFLLGLIVLGSNVAFNILTTLSSSGLLTSYIVCIGCILYKRITRPNELPPSRFTLGKLGVMVNIVALSLLAVIFVFLFFPPKPRPAPAEMNWTVLIYGVTLIGCLVFYMLVGRDRYQAPVALVKKEY